MLADQLVGRGQEPQRPKKDKVVVMATEVMLKRGWRQLHAATHSSLADFRLETSQLKPECLAGMQKTTVGEDTMKQSWGSL